MLNFKHLLLAMVAGVALVACGRGDPQQAQQPPTATNANPDDAAMRQFLDRDQKRVRTLAEIKAQQSASMPQPSEVDHAKK